ncbi:MAG: NAD(P)/FAD-dependent oxidoreductase [Candidatus Omnitrophica bacterium]|nr:NAD(P)/FAD-dependent oxidoreductase [Candidatus Omnitrophota bacterium]
MTLKKNEWDVIVIGAGPAGSTASRIIAEAGIDVLMIEKDKEPGLHNPCAGGMPYALAQKLGLDSRIIEKEIYGCVLHFNSYEKRLYRRYPLFVTVYRKVFDRFLADQAVTAGASLFLSTRVYDVKMRHTAIEVFIEDLTTERKIQVNSKLVVFADGVNTLAMRTFGVGFKKRPDNTCLALTYELDCQNNFSDMVEIFFNSYDIPWGYYWIFPKKDRLNVGVGCTCSKVKRNLKVCLEEFIKNHHLLRHRKKMRFTAGLIPISLARRTSCDSCFIVGDAAGMVNPLTGGGLVYAVKSGELAASTCIETLKQGKDRVRVFSQYTTKLRMTRHYWCLKVLDFVNRTCMNLSGMVNRSLYFMLMKLYFFFFSVMPRRLTRNI